MYSLEFPDPSGAFPGPRLGPSRIRFRVGHRGPLPSRARTLPVRTGAMPSALVAVCVLGLLLGLFLGRLLPGVGVKHDPAGESLSK